MSRIWITLSAATLFACSGAPTTPSGSTASASTASTATGSAAATAQAPAGPNPYAVGGAHAGCAEARAAGGEHACAEAQMGAGHDCGAMTGEPVRFPDATVVTDASGAKVTVVGAKLAGAPVVTVADLLAHPEAWAGKTVRLEGNVSAMCVHERAWFAVQAPGRSSDFVRVFSTPSFLVPENAVGTKARTEGVVEVIETSPETARHLAGEHDLAQGAQQRTVVIRATGAEFI